MGSEPVRYKGESLSVLTPEFAQRFIQKTVKNLPYNVNIMDLSGVIIASKDSSRLGDFHEVASRMINDPSTTGVVTDRDNYIGTKPGINMFIEFRGERVGVICVTGDPKNIQSFAGFVKASMETMLEYEIKVAQDQKSRGKAERFLHYLLFDDEYKSSEAVSMAGEFDLKEHELGLVIIVRSPIQIPRNILLPALTRGANTSHDRIVVEGRNDDYIILKILKGQNKEHVVRDLKPLIESYAQSIFEILGKKVDTNELFFFVGSLQENIDNYRISYNHALSTTMYARRRQQINYFYDHVRDYFRSSVTTRLYFEAFSVFYNLFEPSEKEIIVETIRALMNSNFNIAKTCQELNVHRNTVVFRLKKIREMLNIDPITCSLDREFLTELGYYLEKS